MRRRLPAARARRKPSGRISRVVSGSIAPPRRPPSTCGRATSASPLNARISSCVSWFEVATGCRHLDPCHHDGLVPCRRVHGAFGRSRGHCRNRASPSRDPAAFDPAPFGACPSHCQRSLGYQARRASYPRFQPRSRCGPVHSAKRKEGPRRMLLPNLADMEKLR